MKIKNSRYNTRYVSKRIYNSPDENKKVKNLDKQLIKIGSFVVCVAGITTGIIHFSSSAPVDLPTEGSTYQSSEDFVGSDDNDESLAQSPFVDALFSDSVVEPVAVVEQEPVLENVVYDNFLESDEQEVEKKYLRTTKKVNVRSNCDSSNNNSVIDTLESGVILEFSKDLNNGWYEVIYNNRLVYINSSYVEKFTIENREYDKVVISTGSDVNIRQEATSNSKSLGTMQLGDCYGYVDKMPNGWYKIDYNGKAGYVSNAFSCLETAGLKYESVTTVTSTGTNINIRNQASTNGRVIGRLKNKGETLQYTRKLDNGWYEVLINGHPGYVSGKYVSEGTRVMITNKSYAVVAAERDTVIYRDINFSDPIARLPQYEIGHVYEAGRDYYLINSEQGAGYIKKNDAKRLEDVAVVADESDQVTVAYRNAVPFFFADCTTGAPDTPTDKGIHKISSIHTNYYMPKWKVRVNRYMPFCRDQAIHGVKDVDGVKDIASVVGASVREAKRSHGCIRMYDEDAAYLSENVKPGSYVVVKR